MSIAFLISTQGLLQYSKLCGEKNKTGEISQRTFDEFDKRYYGVENKLINLAKSLSGFSPTLLSERNCEFN
jgi:hypothetical protein